ncbi:kinesin-like protein KIN-14L [Fagus crenata]
MGASISCQDPLKSSSTTRYIRSELLEQMVEHKFLLFSYQIHLNHQYLPEMRNQQNLMEPQTPIKGTTSIICPKSSVTVNARTQRRQSLTCILYNIDIVFFCVDTKDNRNAKTPPPVHPSTKMTNGNKWWL